MKTKINKSVSIEIPCSIFFKKKKCVHLSLFQNRLVYFLFKKFKKENSVMSLFSIPIESVLNCFIQQGSIEINGHFNVSLIHDDIYELNIDRNEIYAKIGEREKARILNRSSILGEHNLSEIMKIKKIIKNESNNNESYND